MEFTHLINGDGMVRYIGPDETVEYFERILSKFDGKGRYAISLSWLPRDGRHPDDLTSRELYRANERYIQAAGSAGGMTVEVRDVDDDDRVRYYTIGRSREDSILASDGKPNSGASKVEIEVGHHEVYVNPNEVLDSEAAAHLFYHYYHYRDILDSFSAREREM